MDRAGVPIQSSFEVANLCVSPLHKHMAVRLNLSADAQQLVLEAVCSDARQPPIIHTGCVPTAQSLCLSVAILKELLLRCSMH